jgi:GNAT superfamily N-acetyltransferase
VTKILNHPPSGGRWIWLTAEMMKSDAWRSAGINCRRFIDFLMIELIAHGGQGNGALVAPEKQLIGIGIGRRYVAAAIREAETLGLVDCWRRGERAATLYGLNWLPFHDGSAPNDRWRSYRNPRLKSWPKRKGVDE